MAATGRKERRQGPCKGKKEVVQAMQTCRDECLITGLGDRRVEVACNAGMQVQLHKDVEGAAQYQVR
jgi:hypothetical protein